MGNRKIIFTSGEHYHVYNRGVDKRDIFCDERDVSRFFQSMKEFNTEEPIGSIYEHTRDRGSRTSKLQDKPLVHFVAYCLNPNHFHFLLEQVSDDGIPKFMQRLGTGYTKYFNEKYERSGALFQGAYKAVHVSTDSYLRHLSAYVNLNNCVHSFGSRTSKQVESVSSWGEYVNERVRCARSRGNQKYESICVKDIVLAQFASPAAYRVFAEDALLGTLERRIEDKEMVESLLLEQI